MTSLMLLLSNNERVATGLNMIVSTDVSPTLRPYVGQFVCGNRPQKSLRNRRFGKMPYVARSQQRVNLRFLGKLGKNSSEAYANVKRNVWILSLQGIQEDMLHKIRGFNQKPRI